MICGWFLRVGPFYRAIDLVLAESLKSLNFSNFSAYPLR
jgi:hypothetical protein